MTIAGFSRVAINPAVCGGQPIIAGTRVRVSDILDMLASGADIAEIVADFPYLCVDDVSEVMDYVKTKIHCDLLGNHF